jgi:hypothetical protein
LAEAAPNTEAAISAKTQITLRKTILNPPRAIYFLRYFGYRAAAIPTKRAASESGTDRSAIADLSNQDMADQGE